MRFRPMFIFVFLFSFSSSLMIPHKSHASDQSSSLQAQLEARAKASAAKTPEEIKSVMKKAIEELKSSKVMARALKVGDSIPSFTLEDINKGKVSSKELLKKGPLIVTFYRGGWCPYCNLQLRDLQKNLSEIQSAGANLVAISPEAPDQTVETVKKQNLNFYVLSDTKGEVAGKFGLNFELTNDLIEVYKKFGIHLDKKNANRKWELPLSATYIVNQKGKIIYAFVDADYKKRAETSDLVKILKGVSAK